MLQQLQDTEAFTPTGCPNSVLMACAVSDWILSNQIKLPEGSRSHREMVSGTLPYYSPYLARQRIQVHVPLCAHVFPKGPQELADEQCCTDDVLVKCKL